MPVVSAWVMPMGILGVVAMPFGLDAECWSQMGYGIEWMDAVSLWVAGLPAGFGRVTTFGTGPLLVATLGLLVIALLKTPLRWSGAVLAALAVIWAARIPVPDVFIADDARTFAVRGADGRLAFHHTGGDTFAIKEWLAADADGRDPKDRRLGEGISCDTSGCIGRLADGAVVAFALTPDAFEDDCHRASLVVAVHAAPPADCAATVIGRDQWRAQGALTLRRAGSGFVIGGGHGRGILTGPGRRRRHADRPSQRARGARTRMGPRCHVLPRATRRRASTTLKPINNFPAHSREGGNPMRGFPLQNCARSPPARGRTDSNSDQYRRNRLTSLPWMRTRLGGRIRTS